MNKSIVYLTPIILCLLIFPSETKAENISFPKSWSLREELGTNGNNGNSADGGSFRWVGHYDDTTGSTGGGQAHENRPPYYALAYIMKL